MHQDMHLRHNVQTSGRGSQPMVFAHGFGCDQTMWRFVAPQFESTHRVVLFDHLGCGRSDPAAYDAASHGRIEGYADDVAALLVAMDLREVVFVGHSVSGMIGLLAALRCPERFALLVMLGPSPRYLNDPATGYVGGFEREDIDSLIELMDTNLVGWADYLASAVMGPESAPPLTQELKASFCAADPAINRRFALATFLGDNRADLPRLQVPAAILQCANDAVAPQSVGESMHRAMPGSSYQLLPVTGHAPQLTHPQLTAGAIRLALASR